MTAEKIRSLAQRVNLETLSPKEREQFLAELALNLNRLDFDERQKLHATRPLAPLIEQMTETERLNLLEKTLPEGFKQLMESLNKMTPEQRKRLVQRGLQDMEEAQHRFASKGTRPHVDDAIVQGIIQNGFHEYLEKASADTKMDLAPLVEQIQVNLQGLRNP